MTSLDRTQLQNAFYWLCSYRGDNNFFGRILNSCRRDYTPMPHPAGVRIDKAGRFCLTVDLEKFNACPVPLQLSILVHEAAHLGLRHFERMIRFIGGQTTIANNSKLKEIWKTLCIASDFVVNDLAVRPLTVGKKAEAFEIVYSHLLFPEKYELPKGLSLEEYFLLLMENDEKREKIMSAVGEGEHDISFDFFDEGGEAGEDGSGNAGTERALQQLKNMSGAELERLANDLQRNSAAAVRTAVDQTTRCRGTVPGCMQSIIEDLLTEPKIPWPIFLRNQVKSVISNKLIHSMTQPNISLYPVIEDGIEPFPGYNNDFTFRITLGTDASGSVMDDDYRVFMGEHVSIMRQFQGVELRVITFDHGIQYEKTFTKTSSDSEIEEVSKELRVRHGYGGTDFCAPFRRVLGIDTNSDWTITRPDTKLPPTDLMVIFTDGFAPVSDMHGGPMPSLKPPCMVIWVICKNGKADPAMQDVVITIDD